MHGPLNVKKKQRIGEFPLQQWLRERATILCYSTLPILFVLL